MTEAATVKGRTWADTWAGTSDEELAGRIRNGESALYEVLMRRYNQRLYRVARAIVRDDAEAEDAVSIGLHAARAGRLTQISSDTWS